MTRGVFSALLGAFASLFSRQMLWLMVWPVLVALAVWGIAAFVFWAQFVVWLGAIIGRWITNATFFVSWDASNFALLAAKILVILMLVPLVQLTALLILGTFGMDRMVAHVAAQRFASLQMRRGGTFAGSLWNSAVALAGMAGLFVLSIPLWFFPPLWPVIPVAILGWVNQRVLRYDALMLHAQPAEMQEIFARRRLPMYALGVVLALISYVPIVGFFAPVLFGLAFIHYLLAELQALRAAPIEGVVTGRG